MVETRIGGEKALFGKRGIHQIKTTKEGARRVAERGKVVLE